MPPPLDVALAPRCASKRNATQMSLRHDVAVDAGRGKNAVGDQPAISAELSNEIAAIIGRVRRWAEDRSDVVGLLLVGSCARGEARPGSDIDLVLLDSRQDRYSDSSLAEELGFEELVRNRSWGALTEWRFVTGSGLEVEINVGSPGWASVEPVDPGTRRVIAEGASILSDPTGTLSRLLRACRS